MMPRWSWIRRIVSVSQNFCGQHDGASRAEAGYCVIYAGERVVKGQLAEGQPSLLDLSNAVKSRVTATSK